jgi:hypothetical protein
LVVAAGSIVQLNARGLGWFKGPEALPIAAKFMPTFGGCRDHANPPQKTR